MKTTREQHERPRLSTTLIGTLALLIAAVFLMPLRPHMPEAGLDPSWQYALNVAIEQHLVFGRDLIFTFGPLGSVYTGLFSPATNTLTLVASALFALGFCVSLALALYPGRMLFAVAVPIIVAVCIVKDSEFISVPFFLLFAITRTQLQPSSKLYLAPTRPIQWAIAFATVAVSITPIVKGSFAGAVGASFALATVVLIRRNWRAALGFAALALISLGSAWVAAGQPLAALPNYFLAQAPIISGYTTAMSLSGRTWVPLAVAATSAVLVATFYLSFDRTDRFPATMCSLGLAFILFVAFKAGLVRQDGHVFISTCTLLFTTLVVTSRSKLPVGLALWLIVIVVWLGVGRTAIPTISALPPLWVEAAWDRSISGFEVRLEGKQKLIAEFDVANAQIRASQPLPHVNGTVDIYPTDLSTLFANDLKWKGRPIFQSYSVYDPKLDRQNVQFLENAGPDTIFYSIGSIDRRLPALDDSGSLIALLGRYSVVGITGTYVQLARHGGPSTASLANEALLSTNARIGEPIKVGGSDAIWADIDIQPTLLGKILSALYKLPQLEIDLTLDSNDTLAHRFIPAIGRTGFLLSPYLSEGRDFALLASGARPEPRVTSFKLVHQHSLLWKDTYSVTLRAVKFEPQPQARHFALAQPVAPSAALSNPVTNPATQCAVDFANGKPFAPNNPLSTVRGVLRMQGWSAPPPGVNADAIRTYFIVERGSDVKYYLASEQQRPDVAQAFKRPELLTAGYNGLLDVGQGMGPAKLTMVVEAGGTAYRCPMEATLL
ncbi:hypothetical protein ABLT15_33205 [Paraburkholderia tropica]|uniref:hypothetical protein n=1 Tax=Paraburkholderia tropica TaxID=92647 RepID=UPI0032B55463